MGSARHDAEAYTPRASAQCCAEPTLQRGNLGGSPHAAPIRLSGYLPVRPNRRPPRRPARRHDRRHRARAGDGRHAAHAAPGERAGPGGQRHLEPRQGRAQATRRLRARRGGVRGRQHHARRLPHPAARGRTAHSAVRSAARGPARDGVRRARRRARGGRREVDAPDPRPGGGTGDAGSGVHRRQRLRGRGCRVGRRGPCARHRRARPGGGGQAPAYVRRPVARGTHRGAACHLRGARRCGAGEAQREGHGRGRLHRPELLRHQGGIPIAGEAARSVRRGEAAEPHRALPGYAGRDRSAQGRGRAVATAHRVDGGKMIGASLLLAAAVWAQDTSRVAEAQSVLAPLVESYGVSGAEGPVRETVKRLLPAWAQTETDTAGNLWVRVGKGDPLVVFVAHLDEIGFTVSGIRDDGSLELRTRGGFFGSLWEAQPALVHTERGDVAGVFMPRDSGVTRHTPPPLRVDVGTTSRAATLARGVSPGHTVTMPKQFVRLAGTRATGRSFVDRVGSTAQILALRRLDRAALKHQVIFIWSVREEIGLEGAEAAAAALGTTPRRVFAIDTFVSADSPLELANFAVAPIGRGAVARALDNSSVTPPAYVDSLVQVARARRVSLQVGTTNGGNDGSVFTPFGVVDVAIGWPLRYSHSPAEVVDLRDVVSLADIIQAVAETW